MAASLASATQSRVDSSSKHIVPVRFNSEYLSTILSANSNDMKNRMAQDNYRYCLNKDDLAIGLGRKIDSTAPGLDLGVQNSAYPSVISCMNGGMIGFQRLLAAWHNNDSVHLGEVESDLGTDPSVNIWKTHARMYYCVGVSLGMASAHASKGDTVASCMVGGLRTICNGHYPIQTNDLIMFYWPSEVPYLDKDTGMRKNRPKMNQGLGVNLGSAVVANAYKNGANYENHYDKDFAKDPKDWGNSMLHNGRTMYHQQKQAKISHGQRSDLFVPMIKPYLTYPDEPENPRDSYRVFARAMSNARPFEMVDLMICRQAL